MNYNAEKELGLKGGIENKFFPTMSGFLAANGTGGMKGIGSEAGSNQITQVAVVQCLLELGQEQPLVQIRLGIPH